jgi:putative protease
VLPDTGCRNTVFNSVPQSGAEYVGRMRELGITRFRIDLLRETPEQVALLTQYARVIAGLDDGRETWRQLRAQSTRRYPRDASTHLIQTGMSRSD